MYFQGKTTSSNSDIADELNYFTNIGSKLAAGVGPPPVSFESFLSESTTCSFFLKPTTEEEISDIISNKKVTSPGSDDISMKVIKECCIKIAPF